MKLDAGLSGLAVALDVSAVQRHLRDAGIAVDSLEMSVVRHHVGERCTIRYAVSAGQASTVLFGKVVRVGADRLARVTRVLADASARDARMPAVMPVVAFVPSAGLVVTAAFEPSVAFHDVALDAGIDEPTRARRWSTFGSAMARLHAADLPSLPLVDTSLDVETIRALLPSRASEHSNVASTALDLLDSIEPTVVGPHRRVTAAHGALRTDQVLLGPDRFALVDLDSAGLSPPARDLGNLLAYLAWKQLRRSTEPALVDRAVAAFHAGYADVAELPVASELSVWQALSMVKIAARRLHAGPTDEIVLVPALLAAAATLLGR